VLARDPDNHDVPLLSPYGGTVDLQQVPGHITLRDLSADDAGAYTYQDDQEHVHKQMGPTGLKRYKLLNLGAWEFIKDAYTGRTPDPLSTPQAVLISTVRFEPFLVRGDVLLKAFLRPFTRGLEHLQSLLEYQPIYLILPKIRTDLAMTIKDQIRGYAWVKLIEVPLRYPYDHFEILSRHLNLKRDQGPIWGVNVEGVLAVDQALTASRPCVERVISLGGPGTADPGHVQLTAGYPVSQLLETYALPDTVAIDGGVFSGQLLDGSMQGIAAECRGITLVPENRKREFLAFVRPGFDRQSYSRGFLSALCSRFPERVTNLVRGEVRPCVSCNFCEEVCPAGIIPHRLHKLIYQDEIDEIERSRIDLCIECGLCSFVCPSKIELTHEFREMKQTIVKEKASAAAQAQTEPAPVPQADSPWD